MKPFATNHGVTYVHRSDRIPRTSLSPALSDVGADSDKRYQDRAVFPFFVAGPE
jgi:hypothetical protein